MFVSALLHHRVFLSLMVRSRRMCRHCHALRLSTLLKRPAGRRYLEENAVCTSWPIAELHHDEKPELVDIHPINGSTPSQRCALFSCCGSILLQVPTSVETLINGPWDPDGTIWRKQLDMALEVIARPGERKSMRLSYYMFPGTGTFL